MNVDKVGGLFLSFCTKYNKLKNSLHIFEIGRKPFMLLCSLRNVVSITAVSQSQLKKGIAVVNLSEHNTIKAKKRSYTGRRYIQTVT